MIVAVYGAWYTERKGFTCLGLEDEFRVAGRQLGELLAQLGHKLIVTSFSVHTLDGYVAEGYVQWMLRERRKPPAGDPPIIFVKFDSDQQDGPDEESDRRYAEFSRKHPNFITFDWARGQVRFNRHLVGLKRAQMVVAIGGADHTLMAGEVALLSGKPLIPVGSFGGAAESLVKRMLADSGSMRRPLLGQLAGPWSESVQDALRSLLMDLRIAIIHGHGEDWRVLSECITLAASDVHSFTPLVMKEIARGAQTLPQKWESLAGGAEAAIAVITPDDLGGLADAPTPLPRARQNVWLEIGWFWGRLGRDKMMLLVRHDVEIPSDFSGVEYHRYQASPAERAKEIQTFLRQVS